MAESILLNGVAVDKILGPSINVVRGAPMDLVIAIERNFKSTEDAVILLNTLIYAEKSGYEIVLNQTSKNNKIGK